MKKILALSLVLVAFLISGTVATASSRVWHVRLTTNKGEIVVKLYDQTPLHRDNFVKLAKDGYFNGILFHRKYSSEYILYQFSTGFTFGQKL